MNAIRVFFALMIIISLTTVIGCGKDSELEKIVREDAKKCVATVKGDHILDDGKQEVKYGGRGESANYCWSFNVQTESGKTFRMSVFIDRRNVPLVSECYIEGVKDSIGLPLYDSSIRQYMDMRQEALQK